MIGQGLTVILLQSHKVNTVGVSNFKMAVLHFVNVTKEEIKSDIRKFHSTKHKNLESALGNLLLIVIWVTKTIVTNTFVFPMLSIFTPEWLQQQKKLMIFLW